MNETSNRKGCVVGGCFIGELEGLEENLSTQKRGGEKRIVSSTLFSYIADSRTA